ncbi:YihY/virulence factor BrkB family protein [Dongia deserti]|uniref:YihY/virulence factor BrkB family protein n=1 Tax=Dongia deserti TaxID=2268030 RepID=UPI000E65C44A|nr:YihY/virulence factor BrkB family protein [Dongia deserti]
MNRLTSWLMTGVTGWLALKSLRAQEETALLAADDARRFQHAEGGHRGRTADRPAEIPPRGWKDILVRTYRSMSADRVMREAAGVTYYVLMALFPGLAALVSIYGLVANPADIERQLAGLTGAIPQEAISIIRGQLEHLASQDQRALSFAFFGSLLVSLWSANAAIKALFDALNVVYGERERRSFIKLNAMSLLFTAGMILFLVLAMIGIVVIPAVLNFLELGGAGALIINVLRWPALLAIVILGLAVLYRYGPDRQNARWRWITWGSVAAAILWLLVSMLFSWYTGNFGNYNKTYGSLGAVIAFMVWTWLSTTVVLMGGELNAEIEHQTAKDSTTGWPQPLGRRGARMADTVGRPQD